MTKTVLIGAWVTPDVAEQLRAEAAKQDRPMSALVRRFIQRGLEDGKRDE